jgi:chorismate mutase
LRAPANTYHYVWSEVPGHGNGAVAAELPTPHIHFAREAREGWLAARGCMEIADWRKRIDELDEQIVQLLSERAAAAVAIGQLKAQNSAPIYEPQREQTVFQHVRDVNPGPLSGAQLQHVYERLMDVMRSLQRPQ